MAQLFRNGFDDQLIDMFGGAECSHCKNTKIVRDSDRLCIDCWELLGEPVSPASDRYRKYWADQNG